MAVDLSVFQNAHTLGDYMQKNQAFNTEQNAANLDIQTKKNIYAAQVLTAATANGDDNQYHQALAHLQQSGIDVSNWPADAKSGAQAAQALRMSMISPLGMLNSEIQLQRNGIQAAGVNSTVAPTGLPALPGMQSPQPQVAQPSALPPSAPAANIPAFQQSAAGQDPVKEFQQAQAQRQQELAASGQLANNNSPPQLSGAEQTQQLLNNARNNAYGRATQQLGQMPANLNPKARMEWQSQLSSLMEKDPEYQQATEQAKSLGTETAKQTGSAVQSEQMNQKLAENIAGMRKINGDLFSPIGMSPENKALISKRLGINSAAVNAQGQWENLTHSLTLNGLAQLVSQSAAGSSIRSNKAIVELLKTGTSIPSDLPEDARMSIINDIDAELNNSSTASSNVKNTLTGQPTQPMSKIPVTTSQGAIKYTPGLIRNGYIFNGGDPKQQSNWKQVQ